MMKSLSMFSLMTCGLLLACGGTPTITPMISIVSPADNSTVNVSASKMLAVNFTTNYTLKNVGGCAGQDACGQVYVLVDSTSCDQPNQPYNTLAVSSPAQADLGRCGTLAGMHTVTVELHHDGGAVVKDLVGNPVTSKATITVQTQ